MESRQSIQRPHIGSVAKAFPLMHGGQQEEVNQLAQRKGSRRITIPNRSGNPLNLFIRNKFLHQIRECGMLVHREHLLGLFVSLLTFYRKGALFSIPFGFYWIINTPAGMLQICVLNIILYHDKSSRKFLNGFSAAHI
ncbi:hypothetical protein ET31_11190 [Geobacillus stearothermophilus]|nr:hypothetical protein ET31_11190 [Geobacillus stearothermophilus]